MTAKRRFPASRAFTAKAAFSAEKAAMTHIRGIWMREWGTSVERMYQPPFNPKVSASIAAENPTDRPFARHIRGPQRIRGGKNGVTNKMTVIISHVPAHREKSEMNGALLPSVKNPDSASIS